MQANSEDFQKTQHHLGHIKALLESGTFKQVRRVLNALAPVEIARLIASSPPPSRQILWEMVDKESVGEVLEELPVDLQNQFIEGMETEDLVSITEQLADDDVVDILQHLPNKVTSEVLEAMSEQDRDRLAAILNFEEDTAGGLTDTEVITVRPRFTVDVVMRYLRRHEKLPDSTDNLIVVNKKDHYLGLLPLSTLLTSDPNDSVREVMQTNRDAIDAAMPAVEVAKLFEQHNWVSAPVINEQGKLIGRITIDDVVDVIRENADHSLMGMAGLDEEEDTFATVKRTIPRRAIWLGINLLTAILASSVISLFQEAIDKVVALAVLMPIVASMGGVAGSQTLTVVIRGMARGQIGPTNKAWLISREIKVGLINGFLWSLMLSIVTAFWFNDITIAAILAAAMVINLLTAALAGTLLPGLLKKMNIDPALAGGVTLTTITDVMGFFTFLGLATYFYA